MGCMQLAGARAQSPEEVKTVKETQASLTLAVFVPVLKFSSVLSRWM